MSDRSTPMERFEGGPGWGFPAPPRLSLPEGYIDAQREYFQAESGYTARAVLAVLIRHKISILLWVVLLTLTSVIIAFSLQPSYVAQSVVILDTRRPEIVQQPAILSNLVSGSTTDPAVVRSEVTVISSAAYARKIIEQLDLLHNPEFLREMNPQGEVVWLNRAYVAASNFLSSLFGRAPAGQEASEMGRAIAAFGRRLSVYNDERSYAITLSYTSHDPQFATKIVNSLAQLYIADQLGDRQDVARRGGVFLKSQLQTLQANLLESERKAAAFEEQNHLQTVLSGTVTEQSLHQMNAQLITVSDERARKEAQLAQVQDLMHSPNGAAAAAQVLSSPLIQKLREQQSDIADKIAPLKEAYNAPAVLAQPMARLREVQGQIAAEIKRITTGLQGEVNAAKLQEASLRRSIAQQQASLDKIGSARAQYNQMQEEVSVNRKLYETFLLRSQQVEADEQALDSGVRFVPAEQPVQPAYPNKLLFAGVGFSGSLLLGILFAFLSERLDETVRTQEDVERVTGVPVLGIVPGVRNGRRAIAEVVDAPLSGFTEAINHVLDSLRVRGRGSSRRVITITSALSGEGKTTFAVALARSAAGGGIRTLLIDCDARRASVGELLGRGASHALETMFNENRTDLAEFVVKDEKSNLDYLPTRTVRRRPQEILGSSWMAELIIRARKDYDLVIIDTPPLLNASDALLLSQMTDTVLLVARWGHTPVEFVAQAARRLQLQATCPIGTVLSMVNPKKFLWKSHAAYFNYAPRPWRP